MEQNSDMKNGQGFSQAQQAQQNPCGGQSQNPYVYGAQNPYVGQPMNLAQNAPQNPPQNLYRNPQMPPQRITKRAKHEYGKTEQIFAVLALVMGWIYAFVTPAATYTLGGLLFVWGIFGVTAAYLCLKGHTAGVLSLRPMVFAVSALAMSVSFIVTENGDIHSWAFFFCIIAYIYWVFTATGNSIERRLSDLFPLELIKAAFVMPFSNFGSLVSATKGKKFGLTLLWTALGLMLAVIPTAIVCALLLYDEGFSELLKRIFEKDISDVFSAVFKIVIGVPIGMYLFGMWISGVNHDNRQVLTEEKCRSVRTKLRFAPKALVVAAIVPLLIVYVLFFISQWKYYVSAFTGVLPAEYSYSEYARSGFFELCAVSGINLFALITAGLFMKRNADGKSVVMKLLAVIISLFTLVLIATALSKMAIYIGVYGLTQKRVYASWFMALLGMTFVTVILAQLFKRINTVKVLLSMFIVMFGALALSNPDGIIAKYNVDAYIDGRIEEMDIDVMYDLGYSGVPEVARLIEWNKTSGTLDAATRADAMSYLVNMSREMCGNERNIFSYNIQTSLAEHILKDLGYKTRP